VAQLENTSTKRYCSWKESTIKYAAKNHALIMPDASKVSISTTTGYSILKCNCRRELLINLLELLSCIWSTLHGIEHCRYLLVSSGKVYYQFYREVFSHISISELDPESWRKEPKAQGWTWKHQWYYVGPLISKDAKERVLRPSSGVDKVPASLDGRNSVVCLSLKLI